MTVRIITTKTSLTTVRVVGRLIADDAAELVRSCEGHSGPVVIDLSDLHSADDEGVHALISLRSRGVGLVGARPYIAMLLEKG